jgi:hypothetical protein
MNREFIDNVFRLISLMKDVKKDKLLISKDDEKLFFQSYFKYNIWKKTTYNKWRNCIINYSIDNTVLFNQSIDYFVDWLKNNNTVNG